MALDVPYLRPFEPFFPRPSDLPLPWGLDSVQGPGLSSCTAFTRRGLNLLGCSSFSTLNTLSTHLHISAMVSLRVAHLTLRVPTYNPNRLALKPSSVLPRWALDQELKMAVFHL